jgi:threonine dehydrogenase-like Zn-dependent dehydrogenase
LHPVPENVSTEAATFTEPIVAALEIQQQVQLCRDDRVLLVGDGKLGQLVAQTIALTGCDLLVVGRDREKLVNLEARGIKTGLSDAVTDRAFDISVECTGNPEGFVITRRALCPRGTLGLESTYPPS